MPERIEPEAEQDPTPAAETSQKRSLSEAFHMPFGDLFSNAFCLPNRKPKFHALGGDLSRSQPFATVFDWSGAPAPAPEPELQGGKLADGASVDAPMTYYEAHGASPHWGYSLAAAVLVLVLVGIGYEAAFGEFGEHERSTGEAKIEGLFFSTYGQATLGATLIFFAVILGPIISPRLELVFFAAAPTAYVWLLPAASKLGFANHLPILQENHQADMIGLIANPEATGVMCALFSMPLLALLRGTTNHAHGFLGVLTAFFFYAWLLTGMACRAPTRFSFPALQVCADGTITQPCPPDAPLQGWGGFNEHASYLKTHDIFIPRDAMRNAIFDLHPPYASFVFYETYHKAGSRFADLAVFALMMLTLSMHAGTHAAKGGLGCRGTVLCVGTPLLSLVIVVAFGWTGFTRNQESWREGPLLAAYPIWAAQSAGLSSLACFPLLLRGPRRRVLAVAPAAVDAKPKVAFEAKAAAGPTKAAARPTKTAGSSVPLYKTDVKTTKVRRTYSSGFEQPREGVVEEGMKEDAMGQPIMVGTDNHGSPKKGSKDALRSPPPSPPPSPPEPTEDPLGQPILHLEGSPKKKHASQEEVMRAADKSDPPHREDPWRIADTPEPASRTKAALADGLAPTAAPEAAPNPTQPRPLATVLAGLMSLVTIAVLLGLPKIFNKYDSRSDLSGNIHGAPCGAGEEAASVSTYIDSPFMTAAFSAAMLSPLYGFYSQQEAVRSMPWKLSALKIEAAFSRALTLAFGLFVAVPLSYDQPLHQRAAILVFALALVHPLAAFWVRPCCCRLLLIAQVLAAWAVLAVIIPRTFELERWTPSNHAVTTMPCADASEYVAESLALSLIALTSVPVAWTASGGNTKAGMASLV